MNAKNVPSNTICHKTAPYYTNFYGFKTDFKHGFIKKSPYRV